MMVLFYFVKVVYILFLVSFKFVFCYDKYFDLLNFCYESCFVNDYVCKWWEIDDGVNEGFIFVGWIGLIWLDGVKVSELNCKLEVVMI